MSTAKDLTGARFERLLVIGRAPRKGTSREARWVCQCDCGATIEVGRTALLRGDNKSCGCFNRDTQRARMTTHGSSKTPTYQCWHDMKYRCMVPTSESWNNYGGRGIIVCERWAESFENFLADMGEKPSGLTLERRDNNGNYEPGNCYWATRREQNRNQRPRKITADVLSEILGRVEHGEPQVSVARRLGLDKGTINQIVTGRWRPMRLEIAQ